MMEFVGKIRKRHISITMMTVIVTTILYMYFSSYLDLSEDNTGFLEFSKAFNMSHIFDFKFNYVIKNSCGDGKVFKAIQIVTSYAPHVELRSALRRAYPQSELDTLGIYRVFLLGMLPPGDSEVTQNAILDENRRFNDIVQGNFLENYKRLAYKNIMGVGWAALECKGAYIVKTDDDIVVDLYEAMSVIGSYSNHTKYDIMGKIFVGFEVIRREGNKWFVSEDEYSGNTYPPFVSGWFYVLKFDAGLKLLHATEYERFFWIDDVLITGILARRADLVIDGGLGKYFATDDRYLDCCLKHKVRCGFFVAPNGGNNNWHVDFQKHSKLCQEGECREYPPGQTYKEWCVVPGKQPQLKNGTAETEIVIL